ncbi:phage repressor protein C with HTH and peptisase S24 domain [Acidovorax delafieldii]|uniref:Phage repressor protein C with HTH and peptisase S24 domain n=1 Tax=Acidovorax delafieldii TaxID=47920 RepID=A0AAJ2BTI9_ACIDE|nr:S24 family peptidase [Acidovorax delafieldii]MDR6767706.1 phage repressor protein C with HTH and peptisase S24 domain [Acidovorax delafieldii]MDR6839688.1 phage repressor protein C with HTH and peptisase S24 domain [Acidovorax delafieldii]MDR7368411.1 phage repressor protein C with HTH and peptisase S24 domain [Acidovorax delafieldii]
MSPTSSRNSRVNAEHLAEAMKLRSIWEATPHKPPQAVFGEMYGIGGQSAVGNFLSGRSPLSLKAGRGFARGLGVALEEFSPRLAAEAREIAAAINPGDQLPSPIAPVDMDLHADLAPVRVVRLTLRAGISGFAVDVDETEAAPIFFRTDWLRRRGFKPYKLIAIKIHGHSMEPTLFHDDVVVINTEDTEPKDGEVFAFNFEGEPVVKRLQRDAATWWMTSDNPDQRRYPRKECSDAHCIILGRVVHRQSERI